MADTNYFSEEEKLEEANEGFRSGVFVELKAYCLELLQLLQFPKKRSSSIHSLFELLRKTPTTSLQHCFDYVLFPLLLLLDAAVVDRSQQKVDSGENSMMSVSHELPHRVSDCVAEGVLQCLEELLKKCRLGSVEQMVVVLKKLTCGALLSPLEASEEFREGIIKCFKAIFMNLYPCPNDACSCKKISGSPALAENREFQGHLDVLSEESKPNECLLEFLRSETASAAVGHWLSLLLKAADIEAARGHHGSSKLRIEAFMTLRILVAKVGTADALAFFLPGVVSQFSKVLRASKTTLSGAAGNTEATNQAIRGLAEYLMIVLEDDANKSSLVMFMDFQSEIIMEKGKKAQYILEELRQLPNKVRGGSIMVEECSSAEVAKKTTYESGSKEKMSADYLKGNNSFHVDRTKEWVAQTSTHVDKLLRATFPYICLHLVKKVRLGILAAIKGLLSRCSCTLKESRSMLLECLCTLAIDESEDVSFTAQEFLEYLFGITGNHQLQHDIAKIFVRLVEKLPNVVLGTDEKFALSHARQLLVVAYYSGPQLIIDHLIHSPVTAVRFLDVFAVCLNQNSVYACSIGKFLSARPSSLGYLHSLTELKVGTNFISDCISIMNTASPAVSELTMVQKKDMQQRNHVLPRMPPWFNGIGNQKLYEALGGVLRLVGLSLASDSKGEGSLSVTIDIPLGNLQKLVSELRKKEYSEENWEYWYRRTGSGQLVRQASTAVCILNEMIFGVSEYSVDYFSSTFQRARMHRKVTSDYESVTTNEASWKVPLEKVRAQLIDCIGRVLHEYLSPEIWDLPTQHKSSPMHSAGEDDISLHFFRDTAMLHQVIIEGIGIFSMCLGKYFSSCGFLHSSLYLLLENLISSNAEVRSTSDAILHVLSSSSGYPTVRNLVLENADYVIDSICRQLRHLDLNPHVPNVLAAILSYIGIAHEILPLLEEPMHKVSSELEILGRHQHPNLTGPFLKAVAEIARVSKHESNSLPSKAASYTSHVKSLISNGEKQAGGVSRSCHDDDINISSLESEWENILFKLNDSRRYRRTVGSIAGSCIVTAIPLLASQNQATCFVALDIVEYGVAALAKVEEAYKHEKDIKEAIEETLHSHSFYRLLDTLDVSEEASDENRLLPAMNKIWPFLVACIQNKNPVVARRCLNVISSSVQICGGDFFTRRFHTDGSHFWKLLTSSPFIRKQKVREEKAVLQLPYRKTSISSEDSVAEGSNLKVQVALLNMIADLSRNRRSASALEVVLKKVSGLVAGVAFSGVVGLREASLNALGGLASMDPDLIWLLVADVYYSIKKDVPLPPTSEFPEQL
ncbi:ARM repeat superfamily protein isoform 2 [Cucumis melo var. makuwa]|uniref:ARM repeat superfamily protein isoform 2 n=1 Tax=Cucumis melo var. makuwa TaxID=1194695 RepID=A0A5D3BCU4_CUCMM|nr:ARM repeat superfamily protein isoform 2 [Cucumis melo var. makuwa]TYJ96786.1 ARM repeat superfamily protein isoform 2 [Cucumis melo var. makuwa]